MGRNLNRQVVETMVEIKNPTVHAQIIRQEVMAANLRLISHGISTKMSSFSSSFAISLPILLTTPPRATKIHTIIPKNERKKMPPKEAAAEAYGVHCFSDSS
jgi:hypothetical protein